MEVLGNALGIIFIIATLVIGTAVFLKRRYIYFGDVHKGMLNAWLECVIGTAFVFGLILLFASAVVSAIVDFILNYWIGILGTIVLLVGISIWGGLFDRADTENANENSGENRKTKRTGIIVCCVGLVVLAIGIFGHSTKETPKNVQQASMNQNINVNNSNKFSIMAEEVTKIYSNMVLRYDVSGTDKFKNKIRLKDDAFVNLFDGSSSERLENLSRKNLDGAFRNDVYRLTEAQMNKIIDARINLQKKAKFDTKIINSDNKIVVRLAIQCIDSALMEKTFEEFLKREAPKRFASYNPGKSFFNNVQSVPPNLIGNLYVEATEYTCEHPSFKENVTNIDLTFSRDAENDERLRIERIPEIVLSFWDGKYGEVFFDNKMFNKHMSSDGN